MLSGKKIAVVVPAFNEEMQIGMVIKGMPDFVDRIIVVDDGSKDNTIGVVKNCIEQDQRCSLTGQPPQSLPKVEFAKKDDKNIYNRAEIALQEIREAENALYPAHEIFNENDMDRIVLITEKNSGVGTAIAIGYKWCREHGIDCTAVMAGDGQMDPSELETIVLPVIEDGIDYVKGNRLSHPAAKIIIPQIRYFGNSVLSLLTKIASGYWSVSDTQTGYTAISLRALNQIALYDIYHSYGCPNDILVKLNIAGCTLVEIPIKPVYDVGEKSKMKIVKVIPAISWLLIRGFFRRLWSKYLINSFHPLFLIYSLGFFLGLLDIPIFIKLISDVIVKGGSASVRWYILLLFLTLGSFLCIVFGMWMDMQDNAKLEKTIK